METIVKNFTIYVSTITASLSYCYYISSKIPKGIYRFISLIPVFFLFTVLPLQFSSVLITGITACYTTWLTNLKLIRFAFDLDHSPFHPSHSLLRFITLTSLPIKTRTTDSNSINTPPHRLLFRLGFQFLICSILLKMMLNHRFYPTLVFVVYGGMLFLIIDMVSAMINALLLPLTGLELEPSSDQPYLATSLQNFWGRWNLLVTNALKHTIYKPVRSAFSNYKWAPLAGLLATFIVSGLMHELFIYQLSREEPTWEMTLFFVIHGICVVVELIVKIYLARRRLSLPKFMAWMLTMGFVATTGVWWLYPCVTRARLDVKILGEYMSVVHYFESKVYV